MQMDVAAKPIIELSTFLQHVGRSTTAQQPASGEWADARIERFIQTASQVIVNHCHRHIVTTGANLVERIQVEDAYFADVYLSHSPVLASPALLIEKYAGNDVWQTLTHAQLPREVHVNTGKVELLDGAVFDCGRWRLTYQAGWTLATVPAPIQAVCCQLTHRLFKRAGALEGVKSITGVGNSASYNLEELMDAEIEELLQPYVVESY